MANETYLKNEKKATVIIPVYNGEKFVRRSVQSVFKQSYPRIELIVINDGSSDRSKSVLKKLAAACPEHVEMRVISQENAGICAARNRALDMATGDYVLFMDQDDRMKRDCIKMLAGTLESRNADMVIGGYILVDEKGKILDRWKLDPDLPWCKYRITAPWGRIFRRNVIERHHIRFMQTKISEDFYFNVVYMSCCRQICVTPYMGYAWTYRPDSESHRNMSVLDPDRDPLVMMTQLLQDIHQPNILEKDLLDYMFIKHIIWYLFFIAKGASRDAFRQSHDACFAWLEEHIPGYQSRSSIAMRGPAGESAKVRMIVRTTLQLKNAGLLYPFLRLYAKS